MRCHPIALALLIVLALLPGQSLRADQDFLKLAVLEAEKIEIRPNHPQDIILKSALQIKAASLEAKRNQDTAIQLLEEAEKLLGDYKGGAKELAPILFPLFKRAIISGSVEGDFSQLASALSSREGSYAFQQVVAKIGHANVDLTLQMIEKACPEELREGLRLIVIKEMVAEDPGRALDLFAQLPATQSQQQNFQRTYGAVLVVSAARSLNHQAIPKPVEKLVTQFAPTFFAEAKKQKYRRDFSLQGCSLFGVAWLHLDSKAATPHLRQLVKAFVIPTVAEDAAWKDRWSVGLNAVRGLFTLAALHQVLGDQAASDKAFTEAVTRSREIIKLLELQPKDTTHRYSFTFDELAINIPKISIPVSERVVRACEEHAELDCGEKFLLELISCTADPERVRELTAKISSPEMKARAYLLIAARPEF